MMDPITETELRTRLADQATGQVADQLVCWVAGIMTAGGLVLTMAVPTAGWLGPLVGLLGTLLMAVMTAGAIGHGHDMVGELQAFVANQRWNHA